MEYHVRICLPGVLLLMTQFDLYWQQKCLGHLLKLRSKIALRENEETGAFSHKNAALSQPSSTFGTTAAAGPHSTEHL